MTNRYALCSSKEQKKTTAQKNFQRKGSHRVQHAHRWPCGLYPQSFGLKAEINIHNKHTIILSLVTTAVMETNIEVPQVELCDMMWRGVILQQSFSENHDLHY